jgi:single-strand DNA-binding protein
MSNDLNKTIMIARLVRDPELKYTPNGTAVARVSVANGYTYKQGNEKKETVSYFNLVFWGKSSEIICEYGKKGMQLAIEGRLSQNRWEDSEGKKRSDVEITVTWFQFMGGKKENGEGQNNSSPEKQDNSQSPAQGADKVKDDFGGDYTPNLEENPFSDEDIPF